MYSSKEALRGNIPESALEDGGIDIYVRVFEGAHDGGGVVLGK